MSVYLRAKFPNELGWGNRQGNNFTPPPQKYFCCGFLACTWILSDHFNVTV